MRDSFISNQDGLVLMSKFRKESRRVQSRILELLLEKHSIWVEVPSEEVDVFEWGDFRYISRDWILFAGYNSSWNSRNSKWGIEYVAKKFWVNSNNLMIISAEGFHIDTVFSVVTDTDWKLIWWIACGRLIENYTDLEFFLGKRDSFYIMYQIRMESLLKNETHEQHER